MSAKKNKDITYEIVRSLRATADIVIERDGRVLVRAPESIPDERIDDIVEAKRYWIYKNLAEWRGLNATRISQRRRLSLSGALLQIISCIGPVGAIAAKEWPLQPATRSGRSRRNRCRADRIPRLLHRSRPRTNFPARGLLRA